jgi:hypothetical protein
MQVLNVYCATATESKERKGIEIPVKKKKQQQEASEEEKDLSFVENLYCPWCTERLHCRLRLQNEHSLAEQDNVIFKVHRSLVFRNNSALNCCSSTLCGYGLAKYMAVSYKTK